MKNQIVECVTVVNFRILLHIIYIYFFMVLTLYNLSNRQSH